MQFCDNFNLKIVPYFCRYIKFLSVEKKKFLTSTLDWVDSEARAFLGRGFPRKTLR